MILRDKYGYPVETIFGKPITNLIRRILHTNIRRTLYGDAAFPSVTIASGAPPGVGPGYCEDSPFSINRAALATPSPQAPQQESSFSPTSAREQSAATASNSPSVGDEMHFIGRVDWLLANGDIMLRRGKATYRFKRDDIVPAATQEQPAGSGASVIAPSAEVTSVYKVAEGLLRLVWRQYGVSGDIPAETLERIEKFLGEGEIWTGDEELDDHFRRTGLLRGSPRKVGEDGARDCFYCHNTHVMGLECTCVCHEQTSVPVGEQK